MLRHLKKDDRGLFKAIGIMLRGIPLGEQKDHYWLQLRQHVRLEGIQTGYLQNAVTQVTAVTA
jgi:hypothetical protein